jgi:hypothetical protein
MNINNVNDIVFEYIVKMIKDDDEIDIYDITEEQYTDIKERYFNDWKYGFDIITEYFGNQSIFNPSLNTFIIMLQFITTEYYSNTNEDFVNTMFMGANYHDTCDNLLRHYAYWYIYTMPFEDFKLKLKNYIDADE